MNESYIRIQQIKLENFKNVKNGTIDLPSYKNNNIFSKDSDLIGLYGQNGSGKTALIEALWILKNTLLGESLPDNCKNYIYQGKQIASIEIIFSAQLHGEKYQLFYNMQMKKNKDNEVYINKEDLSYKKLEDEEWSYKRGIISYNFEDENTIFSPLKNYKLLVQNNKEAKVDLKVTKELARKEHTSFIFSNRLEKILKSSSEFKEYENIISEIKYYSKMNFFVIRNSRSGMINANLIIPLCFQISNSDEISGGDLAIALSEPTTIPKNLLNTVGNVINNLNIVLKELIPDLTIDIKEYGEELDENGNNVIKIELLAKREDINIPLRYESDGIKKIISILSALIAMFNKPTICLAVDELDAGIFEYLLGEILEIIQERGKGQLIFTSHNLRPLEKLDKNSLIFTTTNPSNRYIRFTNVKTTNNLRSFYYRCIKLGGQNEEIYDKTNEFKIASAFRSAGRDSKND